MHEKPAPSLQALQREIDRLNTENATLCAALLQAEHAPEAGASTVESLLGDILARESEYAIITCAADGTVIEWNRGAENIFGWPAPAAIGRPISMIFVPEDRAMAYPAQAMARADAEGHVPDERWYLRQDGSRFYAQSSLMPLRGEQSSGYLKILRDRTDLHRAESRLRASEHELQAIFSEAAVGISELSPSGHFLRVNDAMCTILGRDRQELLGVEVASLTYPDDVANARRLFRHVVETGDPVSVDRRYVRPNGSLVWVSSSLRQILDESGAVRAVLAITVDLTARRLAEAASRQSEERLRAITDAIPLLIAYVDNEQRFQFANRLYETWFNRPLDRIVGHTVLEVMGPAIYEARRPYIERVLAGEEVHYRAELPDGDGVRITEVTHSPHRDADGRVLGFYSAVQDITERYRSERAVHRATERMQLALNSGAILGTWSWDIADNILTADRRFAQTFGLDDALADRGLPIEALMEAIHPDDRETAVERRHEAMARGSAYRAEYRVRQADGSYLWVEANGHCELDENGRPLRFPGVLLNIHERKQAELRLRQLIELAPATVWFADPDGSLSFISQDFYEYTGLTPEIALPHGWGRAIHPEDMPRVTAIWDDARSRGVFYDTELRLRRQDGEYRWFSARAQPLRNAGGEVTGWLGSNSDIHERKTAEEMLAQLNETLEQRVAMRTRERDELWRHSRDLMGVAGEDGFFRSINPAWSQVLGFDEAELLSRPFKALLHPDDCAEAAAVWQALARGQSIARFEDRLRCADGSYRLISWTATPGQGGFYVIGRDITEQRQIEEQLRQSQKMEAIGQLTGGIAHDFNNILTGIIGSLSVISRRIEQGRFDDLSRFMQAASGSAHRAAGLIQRLLAFARRQSLDVKPLDLNRLVQAMEELLRRTLGEQIDLSTVLAPDLWLASADENQLESALLNLAINARDAMPQGGKLTIETANVRLDQSHPSEHDDLSPGDYLLISVTDTGVGMTPQVKAKAFDPFFTTKPIGQGTGLGLSMIYGFAKQSNGHVRIDSEVGRGTTIRLYLPRIGSQTERDQIDPPAELPLGRGEMVLVVEDDPAVRLLVVEVLSELGYGALEAADARAALSLLEGHDKIDLLISDVGLPGMNGRQLAEIARQRRPGLKVLFITGYAESAAMRPGLLDPGMEVVTKPFAMDALALKIREMVREEN
ncbi:PAS domain S-box protein [Chitinimonas lacunae]|uniref:histidine kinase n=1 Tax=Chitinimonas lacunae TaxID=1963018 RepID=A0ABV8MQ26_9NEIS